MRTERSSRRPSRLFSFARRAFLMLLAGACLLAQTTSAQEIPGLAGLTQWRGTLTQVPPGTGLSGTWSVTVTMVTNPATGYAILNGFSQNQTDPQYWISWTAEGTITGGTLPLVGSAHDYDLPFGDYPCDVGGTYTISATTMQASGYGSGSGSCSTTYTTTYLTNVSGLTLAVPASTNCCGGLTASPPPPAPLQSLTGNKNQQAQGGVGKVAYPIDVATGNVFETMTDYATAGPNVLSFMRYYNSQTPVATYAGSMGAQWRTNYDRYLNIAPAYLSGYVVNGSTSNLVAERPDGSQMIFTYTSAGGWTTDSYNDATLAVSGSTYTLTLHDDTVETYTATGGKAILNSIKLRGGYTQTMTYTSGLLTKVSDTYSRKLTFTYTSGLIHTVTTPDSLVLTYTYNTPGSLATVAYNTSPATSQTYGYANTAYPLALTSVTDENGATYESWTYDTYGRALTSQLGQTAAGMNPDVTTVAYNDSTDGSRTVTNALGEVETYEFLSYGGIPMLSTITRTANSNVPTGTLTYTYDINNFVASVEDWSQITTAYTNDTHGDPLTIVENSGGTPTRTTTITYDPTWVHQPGTVVTTGLTTSYTYDPTTGNPLTVTGTDTTTGPTAGQTRVWTLTWSTNFLPKTIKDPNLKTTTFTWSSAGALTDVENALSQKWQITSNTGGGRPLTALDPNSVTTTFTWSPRNWLLTKTVDTAAGNLETQYGYDAAGNLSKVTQPDLSYFTGTYDTAHRLTQVADSFGNSMNYALDAGGDPLSSNIENPSATVTRTHSDTFDQIRRMLTDTSGTGVQGSFGYYGDGDVISYNLPSQGNGYIVDGLHRRTSDTVYPYGYDYYAYDAHDRPLTVTTANSSVTTYVYDGFGDVISEASPDRGTTSYTYDADGNLTQKEDALSVITNYTYDAVDRLLTVKYPADAGENVTYKYDQTTAGFAFGVGRLTSLTDMAGSLTRTYDERGNLITEVRTSGTTVLTTTYGYDAASRVASITYPSNLVVTYVRDAMGRVTSVTGKPSGASSATTLASAVTYEPLGPWTGLTFGNGIAETVTYDQNYNFLTLTDIGTASVQNFAYAYPNYDLPGSYTDNLVSANTMSTITYDGIYRVTYSNQVGIYHGYDYDDNGNMTTGTSATTPYTATYTPDTNQLATIVTGSTTTTVSTNANGSITGFSPAYGSPAVTSLSYNKGGRLTSVSGSSGTLGAYVYDGFGNRFSKTVGTAVTLYQNALDGPILLEETTASTPTDYIYINGRPLAILNGSTFTYLHDNALGVPQVATSSTQAIVWNGSYLAFGQPISVSGSVTVNLRLPGQYFDAETGFNHNGFRDYMPNLGRYAESDLIGLWAGTKGREGLNTYLYASGSPMANIDPWGLVDVTVVNPLDPYAPPTNAYNPPQWFTFAGHGNLNNPYNIFTVGDEGQKLGLTPESKSVRVVGDMILAKWDRQKPLYSLVCWGNSNGFDANLAQYLANKIGAPVTIWGTNGNVSAYLQTNSGSPYTGTILGIPYGPPIPPTSRVTITPNPSQFQPVTRGPQ